MYSLMIVDDEPIVLKAISHVVESYCPQIKIAAKTGSGLEAVSLVMREKPDIIMLDIELVGLNGLEAADEIKKSLPETVIIIISAYDNFHYAQKSIALGVMEYLLKPVSKNDLIKVLAKAAEHLEEQRGKMREQLELKDKLNKMRPYLEEELFFSLLYPGIGRHPLHEYPHLLDLRFKLGQAIEIRTADSNLFDKNFERYKQLIKNQLAGSKTILFGPIIGRTALLLLGYDQVPEDLVQRLERILQAFQNEWGMSAKGVLGKILPGINGMMDSFRELRQAAWQSGNNAGVFWVDELEKPPLGETVIPWKLEQEFFGAIKVGQGKLARLIFNELQRVVVMTWETDLQSWKDYFQGMIAVLQRIFYENAPEASKQSWDGTSAMRRIGQINAQGEIAIIFDEVIGELTRLIVSGAFPEKNPEIRAAIQYMEQNYHREITLPDIAMAVAISPGYLTKIFKEYRNKTVMDFLERIRMEQALKLLNETHYSIKEIAGRVGYKDPNYFSKVFKKVTNSSPTERRG